MTPTRRILLAIALSVVWAVAFIVGVDRDALYPILGSAAGLVVAVTLAVDPSVRAALRWRTTDACIGLVVGVASVAATHVGFAVAGPWLPSLGADVARLQAVAGVSPERLLVVLLIAVTEELLWRGLLVDALRQRGQGTVATLAIAAGLYGASQVGPRSGWLVVAAVAFGVVWGAMRLRSGGLWMPIAAHVVWTVAILGLVPLG